ncbi:MAG: hypothetical protein LC753_05040 [Acidobacteria bacterium]|nr:hypothetical protein [Acidobacteriota bacterium]MCA1649658.1 hypothetical protein [Acidobacteriota bacterium]
MNRARIGIIAAAILAVATVAFAQKPDFSGTWTLDPEASQMGPGPGGAPGAPAGTGGGGRGMGMPTGPVTIKQTADTLTIERTIGENKVVTTYKLDGTASVNTMAGRQGGTMTQKSTSKWDGAKLVTTITSEGPNGPITRTEIRWIDGATMIVEGSRPGRDGTPMTTKQVFKKTT